MENSLKGKDFLKMEQKGKKMEMNDDIDVAGNCQPKTSNLNANVRTKVSSWVTNFVSEMRTKSPAVVQRWVDSLPHDSVTDPIIGATCLDTDDLHLNETIIEEVTKDRNDEKIENSVHASTVQVDDIEKSSPVKHQLESNTRSYSAKITLPQTESQAKYPTVDNCLDSHQKYQKIWHRGTSIISSLRKRGSSLQTTETDDLNSSVDLSNDERNPQLAASTNNTTTTTTTTTTTPTTSSQISTILNKSKLNELIYDKLNISRKRYNFITERRMEAKKIINNAKSRFLATSSDQQHQQNVDDNAIDNNVPVNDKSDNNNLIVSAADALAEASASTSNVCDNIEMDISTDEFSRLSQSNDLLSADDDNSFNISMPSINDGPSQHLSVNRKMIMADIGRSTSDNPRLRNKFYLADIGRSFSEHQDDDAIIISERNISAPTSSIAIQNNNKSNGNLYERRAYSVSPTQRNLKRDVLSRDHSLSDSSRHRHQLSKGSSFQSDSSHCSSVESLLDARKPDPEAILRHLGFGPAHQEDLLSRIPKRFLKPSQVNGIDTETFMRQQQIASNLHEQSILGYRGLVGTPHIFPSVIVAKIMERFQLSDEKNTKIYDTFNIERPMSAPPTPGLSEMPDLPDTGP